MQFPLYKLFIVVAVYAVALSLCSQWGPIGIAIGVVMASSASGIVLLARKQDLRRIMAVEYGCLLGAAIAGSYFTPTVAVTGPFRPKYGVIAGYLATGAFLGGLIASRLLRIPRKP